MCKRIRHAPQTLLDFFTYVVSECAGGLYNIVSQIYKAFLNATSRVSELCKTLYKTLTPYARFPRRCRKQSPKLKMCGVLLTIVSCTADNGAIESIWQQTLTWLIGAMRLSGPKPPPVEIPVTNVFQTMEHVFKFFLGIVSEQKFNKIQVHVISFVFDTVVFTCKAFFSLFGSELTPQFVGSAVTVLTIAQFFGPHKLFSYANSVWILKKAFEMASCVLRYFRPDHMSFLRMFLVCIPIIALTIIQTQLHHSIWSNKSSDVLLYTNTVAYLDYFWFPLIFLHFGPFDQKTVHNKPINGHGRHDRTFAITQDDAPRR